MQTENNVDRVLVQGRYKLIINGDIKMEKKTVKRTRTQTMNPCNPTQSSPQQVRCMID